MASEPSSNGVPVLNIARYFKAEGSIKLNESDRLRFARQVLLGIALLCGAVIAAYACAPENPALVQIFELVKIGALPIVTLVISFYFPNNSAK